MPPSSKAESSSSVPGNPPPVPGNRYVIFALLAVLGAAADLISKQVVFAKRGLPAESDVWWLIEGYVGIETAVNTGAVFGLGAGRGLMFAALSVLAAIGILVWLFWFRAAYQLWLTVALGCVMGGIFGNLYDRLGLWWQPGYPEAWRSGVRDWILFQAGDNWKWPNFNIADSLLVIGAAMLLWKSFFPGPPHGSPAGASEAAGARENSDTAADSAAPPNSAAPTNSD